MQNDFIESFDGRMRDELLKGDCSSILMTPARRAPRESWASLLGEIDVGPRPVPPPRGDARFATQPGPRSADHARRLV